MLAISTRVDRSGIHGLGLFASAPIAREAIVWRFTPGFDLHLDPSLIETLPSAFREYLSHYGYINLRTGRYILCCDNNARFINHSDQPNIQPDFSLDRYGADLALRDIATGEEITIDYGLLEETRPGGLTGRNSRSVVQSSSCRSTSIKPAVSSSRRFRSSSSNASSPDSSP